MDSSADGSFQPGTGGDPGDGPAAPYSSVPPGDDPPVAPVPPDGDPPTGPAPADDAPLTQPAGREASDSGPPEWDESDWDVPDEARIDQGMWLTASAWLPPELLSSDDAAQGAAGSAGLTGFGQGGVLDQLSPGPVLATFLAEAAGGIAGTGVTLAETPPVPAEASSPDNCPSSNLARLTDDDLTGMIRAWRKQASQAQAGELAAVAELTRRRHAEAVSAGFRDSVAADGANDEVAAALTLTGRGAELLTDHARAIQDLPLTFAALAAGRIDMPKALVLLTGLGGQEPELARAVEAEVIDRAETQTAGQLRRHSTTPCSPPTPPPPPAGAARTRKSTPGSSSSPNPAASPAPWPAGTCPSPPPSRRGIGSQLSPAS